MLKPVAHAVAVYRSDDDPAPSAFIAATDAADAQEIADRLNPLFADGWQMFVPVVINGEDEVVAWLRSGVLSL
jgi:hypothetical protein